MSSFTAPQGYQPLGPMTYKLDNAVTTCTNGAGLLVKRTATGVDLCGAGDTPIGVIFENGDQFGEVAVYPLGSARFPVVVSADGNLATIGVTVVPDTGGLVKAGAATASCKLVTDSAGNVGEIIQLISGAS